MLRYRLDGRRITGYIKCAIAKVQSNQLNHAAIKGTVKLDAMSDTDHILLRES